MDSFEKREEGFERAFSHQEEVRFKARVRRDRRIAEWAAEKLGLSGDALQAYVAAIVDRQLETPDDAALVAELGESLENVEPKISAHRIGRRLEEFGLEAMREIQSGR